MHKAYLIPLLALVGVVVLLPAGGAETSMAANTTNASDVSDYYDTVDPSDVDNDSYMNNRTNATLENSTSFLADIGGFFIGTNQQTQAGAGALVLGLTVFGSALGAIGLSGAGIVGGAVLGTVSIAALVVMGMAPGWLWIVVLFIVGSMGTAAFYRLW